MARNQQQLWSPKDTFSESAPDICGVQTYEMILPKILSFADVPDDIQLVTYASGSWLFTNYKHERLTEIRFLLAYADFSPKPADIILCRNGLCYQFLHTNANTVKVDIQIAIGCIKNVQAPERIDTRFCSRIGAKPQKKIARYTV